MTLDQLEAFLAVIEHGSIRAGARALNVAQSGLTKQIRRLEQHLGATLFTRSNSGITLTPHGDTLLARARIILGECERAEQDFQALRGELEGNLRIGASSEAFARFLPACLTQLHQVHPRIKVHIASGPSALLLSGIREGRLDFAITLVSKGNDMTDLRSHTLTQARPRILCRRGHPLITTNSIHELASAQWINTGPLGQEGTPSNRLGDWFTQNQLPVPSIAVTVDSLLDTLHLLAQSDYLFLGPDFILQQGSFATTLSSLTLREPIPPSEVCLVRRSAIPLSPAAQTLASIVISYTRLRRDTSSPA